MNLDLLENSGSEKSLFEPIAEAKGGGAASLSEPVEERQSCILEPMKESSG